MNGKVIPLNQNYPEQARDRVITYDSLSSGMGYRTNPDTLVGRRGLAIYSKMANDEQVKAVLVFKRDAITARGWQFTFRDKSSLPVEEQSNRVHLFNEIVARMRGSFSDALNAIMTGRAYGFSITEKVYGSIEVDGKEWPGINMLLGRDPLGFRFYTDDFGVLKKIEQQSRNGVIEVDRARVIHYVHAPEWDHVYGRSDLREAYRSWYIKDQISNLWPLYLERFAGGFITADIDPQATLTTAETAALDAALKNAKSLGSILAPPGVKINVVHPPGDANVYETALQFHDMAIAKALLVPNLLGISHTGQTGSFSQSQTQLEAFYWTLNADAVRLEECINEQLFRDLGDQAWGDGDYPEFRFKPASFEHVKWVLSTWKDLLGAKAVVPTEDDEAFIRELMEMPPRDAKTKPLVNPVDEQHRQEDMQAKADAAAALAEQTVPSRQGMTREDFEWNEGEHPRAPEGKSDGGEFVPKGGKGSSGGRAAKSVIDKVLRGESHNKTFKPRSGKEQRQEYMDAVEGIHQQLLSAGYKVATSQKTSKATDVNRTYEKGGSAVKVEGRARLVEQNPNMPSWYNNSSEFVLRVIRTKSGMAREDDDQPPSRGTLRTNDCVFITFESETSRDGWLAALREGDALLIDHDVMMDCEPPGGVYAAIHVGPRDSLPGGSRLVMTRTDPSMVLAARVEVPDAS